MKADKARLLQVCDCHPATPDPCPPVRLLHSKAPDLLPKVQKSLPLAGLNKRRQFFICH